MSSPPSPPQALAELPTGAPPNVLVVGAAGVGKSALIGAMSSQAAEHGLVLAAAEGLPSGRALEAYAKVARTPSPRVCCVRGRPRHNMCNTSGGYNKPRCAHFKWQLPHAG